MTRAFALNYPDATNSGVYSCDPRVEVKGETIRVTGTIFYAGSDIGDFQRTLSYSAGRGRAFHDHLEIADAHKERGISKEHYTKAIRFYDEIGIASVRMEAAGEGPWVWPQYGFDLKTLPHKDQLLRLARERGLQRLPAAARLLYAAEIASKRGPNGEPVGIECLKAFHRRIRSAIPMVLDLCDKSHRKFLVGADILPVGVDLDEA